MAQGIAAIGVGGFAVGRFARAVAQDGTPGAEATPVADVQPLGYASLRVRELADADLRDEINEIVRTEFMPTVQALPGYAGYLLGDVIDEGGQNLSLVVLEEAEQIVGFNEAAQAFVGGLDPKFAVETPVSAEGDVLIAAAPTSTGATPVVDGEVPGGYVAVRIHASKAGTDPRDFVPLAISGFLPIVQGLPGFQGYLWFPSEGGFTAVSLFDSEESATESTAAAADWAAENLADYTDGNPMVINATIVLADLPILNG
jgi:hypothetical protein